MASSESPELPLLPTSLGITIFPDRFRLSINRPTCPINRRDGDTREFFTPTCPTRRSPISSRHREIEIVYKVHLSICPVTRNNRRTRARFCLICDVVAYFRKISQMVDTSNVPRTPERDSFALTIARVPDNVAFFIVGRTVSVT